MKLEVGDYVRTKKGKIAKIVSKEDVYGGLHREEIVFILDIGERLAIHSKKVVKSSKEMIGLLEVGDYVNGVKVLNISEFKDGSRYIEFDEGRYLCKNYQIKSILTKEQYENNCYRIEE